MKPVLKRLHSPDVQVLETFEPDDSTDFGVLIQFMIGPDGEEGEESFDVVVCTTRWLDRFHDRRPAPLRHHLLVHRFDLPEIVAFVERFLDGIEGETWQAVGEQVGRLGRWEFEDYQPFADDGPER